MRTVHSNTDVIEVIFTIVKHFNWRWVAFLNSDDDYGSDGLALFTERIRNTDICLAYTRDLAADTNYSQLFKEIERQRIRVIIVFTPEVAAEALIESAVRMNITNKVWVASDAWSLNKRLPKMTGIHSIGTVLGVAQPVVTIPSFSDFIHYSMSRVKCEKDEPGMFCNQVCKCNEWSTEEILDADPSFSFPVYSAVYAIAHALHSTLQCGATTCKNITVYPNKVSMQRLEAFVKDGFIVAPMCWVSDDFWILMGDLLVCLN